MKSEDTILEEDEIDEDSETVLTEPTPLIRELPLNCQIYNWIDSFGPSGVTTVMFTKQGPKLPHRMVKLFIKQSASMPVYAVTTQDWTITKTMKIISRKALCSHGNNDPQQQAIIQDILTGAWYMLSWQQYLLCMYQPILPRSSSKTQTDDIEPV
jgi:hypothetical protein